MTRGGAQSRGQQWRAQEEAWQREDAQLARTRAELAAEIRAREEQLRALQHRAAALEEQRRLGAERHSGMSQVRLLTWGFVSQAIVLKRRRGSQPSGSLCNAVPGLNPAQGISPA